MKSFAGGFLLLAFLGLFVSVHSADIYRGWELKQVDRLIQLQTQNVRHQIRLVAVNAGDQAASSLLLALPSESASHLAYVAAVHDGKPAEVTPSAGEGRSGVTYFSITLNKAIAPKEQAAIDVIYVFTHVQQPYPTHISQMDSQLVTYADNHYFFSPYAVRTQKTGVKLPSAALESYSQEARPAVHKGDTINYGPYEGIQAYQQSPLKIHFENNTPFLTITKMVREIEVSHWGNVAITEHIDMQHDGAKLQGSFSRFEYQRSQRGSGVSSIRSVLNLIPLSATEIYYRDEIGNISTSDVTVAKDKLAVDLTPRFPLFGGWKTQFTFGYDLPLSDFVFADASESSKLVLNTTFGKEIALDAVIDDLTIRVILPEGAKNARFELPFAVDSEEAELHYTYLDTSGRPMLVLHKKNVVAEHNQHFQVSYNFSKTSMLLEPLILVITYFVVFLFAMIYVRFDLSISREKILDPKEAKQAKIQQIISRVRDIHEERSDLQQAAANKAASGKTAAAVQERKKAETTFNATHKEVQKIEAELEELHVGVATKVKQLERKEREKQSLLNDLVQNEEINQDRKGNSNVYEAKKTQLQKAFAKVDEEVEDLVYELTEEF
jgi:oligosaccharyltransferase complex subunit alpha (ribophorin I)